MEGSPHSSSGNPLEARLLAVARETARAVSRQPGVVAVALTGSLAAGTVRPGSDVDLAVYWQAMPTREDLGRLRRRLGGVERDELLLGSRQAVEAYFVGGVPGTGGVGVDLRHATVAGWEADMDAVLVAHTVPHPGQGLLHGLLEAVPLYGHALHRGWQERARAYPDGLARVMVGTHLAAYSCLLGDERGGAGDKLAGPGNLLARHETRLQSAYGLLAALCGLNRLYWSGGKRMDRLIARMTDAPEGLWVRLGAVFAAPLEDDGPGGGWPEAAEGLDSLWGEAWGLFARRMPDVVGSAFPGSGKG